MKKPEADKTINEGLNPEGKKTPPEFSPGVLTFNLITVLILILGAIAVRVAKMPPYLNVLVFVAMIGVMLYNCYSILSHKVTISSFEVAQKKNMDTASRMSYDVNFYKMLYETQNTLIAKYVSTDHEFKGILNLIAGAIDTKQKEVILDKDVSPDALEKIKLYHYTVREETDRYVIEING